MGFFPLLNVPEVQDVQEEPLSMQRELDYDFETNQIKLANGAPKIVEGLPAIKIWIHKTLRTQRFRYDAYTWDYGTEFDDFISEGLSRESVTSETRRTIKEALLVNKRIIDIKNIQITFGDSDALGNVTNTYKMNVSLDAVTIYGEVSVNV